MNSIIWHDYETFGAHPAFDRPAQFAGIRTDESLNEIGEPVEWFCRLPDDYLPHPQAVLVTGITPQDCQRKGVSERVFIDHINRYFSEANSCVAGYNSIRFDDEFTRHTLFRNFLDPYEREYKNGNSRWDLLDVMRCAYALCPDGIEWPKHADGKISFKLEHLTAANGLDHGRAHDAVSDVRATISVARLLKTKQPKLYDFLYHKRQKNALLPLVDVVKRTPLIHVSGMYPVEQGCMAVVVPLCWHPSNKNSVIVWDLARDPAELFDLSADDIALRIFSRQSDLPEGVQRLPIKEVHLNKSPVLAPANTLTPERAQRWNINGAQLRTHLASLRQGPDITTTVQQVFAQRSFDEVRDVDASLYGGFFSQQDKTRMNEVVKRAGWDLVGFDPGFDDPRLSELLFRYRARNDLETLESDERARWESHRRTRLLSDAHKEVLTFEHFARALMDAAEQVAGDREKSAWLEDLRLYAESIYPYDEF